MKVIGFNLRSKYLLFPFVMPVFWFLRNYIGSFLQNYGDGSGHAMKHHPIFLSFITIFADLLAGSLCIFTYFRLKSDKMEENTSHRDTLQAFTRVKESLTKPSFLTSDAIILAMIFVVSFFEVTMISGFFILGCYANPLFSFTMNITLILFEAIISAPILKYKIYKHQIVSILIVLIGFILVCIPQIMAGVKSQDQRDSFIFYPIYCCFYIIFALLDVTQKCIMEMKLYTPYKLVLVQGSFSCVIFTVILFILPFFRCKWAFCNYNPLASIMIEPFFSTFGLLFSSDVLKRALMVILYELISGVYIMLLLLTIYYFTPTQRSVSDSLASFINWIIAVVETQDVNFSPMALIGYLIVLFSCLIYNEIIILYFFGLEDYTKKEIDKRSSLDKVLSVNRELDLTDEKLDRINKYE